MSAQVTITQLPAAGAITGTESVPIVQNGQTVQTTTGAIAASPALTATFLTKNQEPTLANSRYLSTNTGITLTDGGAQSFYQVGLTGAISQLNALGGGIVVKDSGSTLINRSIAASGAGLSVTFMSSVLEISLTMPPPTRNLRPGKSSTRIMGFLVLKTMPGPWVK